MQPCLMQVLGFDIPKTRYMYGTGIISVIGTSFTFLNVTAQSIGNMMVCSAPMKCLVSHTPPTPS